MANIITKYDHENCYYDIEKQNENLNLEQNFKLWTHFLIYFFFQLNCAQL